MKREKRIRVLVVDDSQPYRQGLMEFLQHEESLEVVGEAEGGQEAIYLFTTLNPDVVLMDISMPGTNGLLAAREIKKQSPRTKIVFITIHQEESYRVLGDLIGADGYVCKNSVKEHLKEILNHIRDERMEKAHHSL